MRRTGKIAAWVLGIPLALMLVLYAVLVITPIPMPFVRDQARAAVLASLPPSARLELGDMALALEGWSWPVLQFAPVVYTDTKTGAKIRMEALEVGFSPVRAVIGQPGATVTMVGPHIQVNQDLLGPRLASLDVVEDPNGGPATVRVLEGEDVVPEVGISSGGISVRGTLPNGEPMGIRSDNDWLIYNVEAAGQSMADLVKQAQEGRFSRLVIRDGQLDMNDAVYGLFRRFTKINLDIAPNLDGRTTQGTFSATLAGRTMSGTVERVIDEDGSARLRADIGNIDFASVMPFVDDPQAVGSIVGGGSLSADVRFDNTTGEILKGNFNVDLTGTDLRLENALYPVVSSIIQIAWTPALGEFKMDEAEIRVGNSSGKVSGVFILGMDELFGSTISMSMTGRDVVLQPNDMGPPETPFTEVFFSGWSAPLYGAFGIDQMIASKPGARLATKGRIDMLQRGVGFDLTIGSEGISADDLKRMWPYLIARESRDWFVKNVTAGTVKSSTMRFSFPVGTIAKEGETKPVPQNGVFIDMVGTGVTIKATDTLAPIAIEGETRLQMRDSTVTISADGATIATPSGPINFANAALVMGEDQPLEISGDISGGIPALVALAKQQQPDALAGDSLPIDLASLGGNVQVGLVSTITLGKDGAPPVVDYALSGTVRDFGSTAPIQNHAINDGQFSFSASQQGYRVAGNAKFDGLPADVVIEGEMQGQPSIQLSSTIDAKDLAEMGFDASEFLDGRIQFAAEPLSDGTLKLAVDLTEAALTIKDLGITKEKGTDGRLAASIKQTGDITELNDIDLAFGDVQLKGSLEFDAKAGLRSAEFSSFALSPGDKAQLALTPIRGGYAVRIRGDQLDLKPMLGRFFGLGQGSGGPKATQFTQTIALDLELGRALGFHKTMASDVALSLALKGTDLQKVSLRAQLTGGSSISVTTNQGDSGKVTSVAFNDLGAVLRLMGVYERVQGGEGSLVMTTDTSSRTDVGRLELRNFALIDEQNVAEILENHPQSRSLIAGRNNLQFKSARVDFIRRKDRVEITEGVLAGQSVGGTARGFIYTDKRQYDIVGTYVPMFGLNSAFQKIPIFGELLGGREGEGLFGVTFAVRGPLDKPDFKINPASLLTIGAFRSLFEYRAKELPREE